MPELPEVETLRRQLEKAVCGERIKDVMVLDKRIIKDIGVKKFCIQLKHVTITGVHRRGKVLVFGLDSGKSLVVHLRISGWIVVSRHKEPYTRLLIKLKGKFLCVCDQRILGEVRICSEWQKLPFVKNMGPEALEISRCDFVALCKSRSAKIKPLLMDQRCIAGVGNIYAQEALYDARIHPARAAHTLTHEEISRLYRSLRKVLQKAISNRGTSFDTFRQLDGEKGEHELFLKVYQRKGMLCLRCHRRIQRCIVGGRGTYLCAHCQR